MRSAYRNRFSSFHFPGTCHSSRMLTTPLCPFAQVVFVAWDNPDLNRVFNELLKLNGESFSPIDELSLMRDARLEYIQLKLRGEWFPELEDQSTSARRGRGSTRLSRGCCAPTVAKKIPPVQQCSDPERSETAVICVLGRAASLACRRFYIHPTGRFRRTFDSVLLIFVLFNAVEVPFVVGYGDFKNDTPIFFFASFAQRCTYYFFLRMRARPPAACPLGESTFLARVSRCVLRRPRWPQAESW